MDNLITNRHNFQNIYGRLSIKVGKVAWQRKIIGEIWFR